MTSDLKILMDRATDRPVPFTPDPDAIVAAGRRRIRNRRIAGSMGALATVVVIAAGVAVAVDLQDSRGVAPATQSTTPPTVKRVCTTSTGAVLGDEVVGWKQVMSVTDAHGTATVLRTPDESQYAYCVTEPAPEINVPLGARGGVLVRKAPVSIDSSMTTVFGRAYGPVAKAVVETGDGRGDAVVKSTFYIYRHLEPEPWPGKMPTVLARTLDAHGNITSVGRW